MSNNTGPIDKFPTVWLTYRERIKLDLANVHAKDKADHFFNESYMSKVSAQQKQLADWTIKLLVAQIALTVFQVIGFISAEGSISIFGVTLKQAAGVKEMVLALSATVGLVTWIVMLSRDNCQAIIDTLLELNYSEEFLRYAKIGEQTPFNLKFLTPPIYEQYLFATRFNKATRVLFGVVILVLFLALLVFSLAANVFFFLSIYWKPTLGAWSFLVLGYVSAVVLFGILFFVRFYIPQPFSDNRIIAEVHALKDVDEGLYRRMVNEVYAPKSKYRSNKQGLWKWVKSAIKRD